MNKIRVYTLPFLLAVVFLPLAGGIGFAQSKEQREKIDRMAVQVEDLKTELVLLQRTTQQMQDTFNKTMGELNTLITQMSDNISNIRRAQESVSTKSGDVTAQVTSIGERVTATNERIERLSEQFAQVKKLIEDIPKQPVAGQIIPGNPEQLFAAAYIDYSRGNDELALSEFRQYVETYPGSEMADNAQYWVGEILYAQKKLPEASAAFEQVKIINPNGDKTSSALYKRGLILLEMQRREEGIVQLLSVYNDYSKTKEAELAKNKLAEVSPESLINPTPKTGSRSTRRPSN
ncbi:MAG TPA: outer membrane protein assembly factor BamD [Blastocatellia bacterium]|nr:outer membrane protein assembly factor BamD [Blastocatellia bacterium]